MSSPKTVVFLCAANQGRSVLAEYLFRQFLKEAGITGIAVASAGVSPGLAVNRRPRWQAIALLDRRGIDARGHRSRPLTEILARGATLLVAMNESQRNRALARFPGLPVHTVRGLTGAPERPGVPDIIFGSIRKSNPFSLERCARTETILAEALPAVLKAALAKC